MFSIMQRKKGKKEAGGERARGGGGTRILKISGNCLYTSVP